MSVNKRDLLRRFDEMLKRGEREAKTAAPRVVTPAQVQKAEPRKDTIRIAGARIILHWGFAVRIPGATAAQLSLPLAPPTTIVGAFAAPLFRTLGLKDVTGSVDLERGVLARHFDCALRATLAASMGLVPLKEGTGLSTHEEISRITAASYKTGGSWERALKSPMGSLVFYSDFATEAMPVQAMGATYGPGAVVDIFWVFDVGILAQCLGGQVLGIDEIDDAGKIAVYGVSRLGSKEGITAVNSAIYVGDGFQIARIGDIVASHLYVPARCVEPIWNTVAKIRLWGLSYEPEDYYLPEPASGSLATPPLSSVEYRIVGECAGYIVNFEGTPVAVIGGRRWS